MKLKGTMRTLTIGLLILSMLALSACTAIGAVFDRTPETTASSTVVGETDITTAPPQIAPEVERAPALVISELMPNNSVTPVGVRPGLG